MADIKRYPLVRHLRAEPAAHVIRYRRGKPVTSSRGAAFFFRTLTAAVVEVPVDDREQTFVFTGRSADFQDASVSKLTLDTKGGAGQGGVLAASVALSPDLQYKRFCSASMAGPPG